MTSSHRITLSAEAFDEIKRRLDEPARPPSPEMVELLRRTRGHIKHVGPGL